LMNYYGGDRGFCAPVMNQRECTLAVGRGYSYSVVV
jgi:hypothetical protein